MNKNLITRYIWLVDTLRSYGRLTRSQINELWQRSILSDGNPLPERTFYHYRRAIEEIFNIEISCTRNGEYYIDSEPGGGNAGLTDWLLDSFAVGNLLSESSEVAERVEIEEVPSAREFLQPVINALRERRAIRFDYAGFKRSRMERNIDFHPYYLKRYKQRWYMLGHKPGASGLRTYALDRVKRMELLGERYEFPDNLDIRQVFGNIIGVTSSKAEVRTVKLQATRTQAKYFRALPLHPSQKEELTGDEYSVFTYRLQLNYELVHEIMGLGDEVKVLEPRELRLMVADELKKALDQYQNFN